MKNRALRTSLSRFGMSLSDGGKLRFCSNVRQKGQNEGQNAACVSWVYLFCICLGAHIAAI